MEENFFEQSNIKELLQILEEAEDDVINERVEPMQQSFDDIRKELLARQ